MITSGTYKDRVEAAKQPLGEGPNQKRLPDYGLVYAYLYAHRHDFYKLVSKLAPEDLQQERGLSGGRGHPGQPAPPRTNEKKRAYPDENDQDDEVQNANEDQSSAFYSQAGETLKAIQHNLLAPSRSTDGATGSRSQEVRPGVQERKRHEENEKWKFKCELAHKRQELLITLCSSSSTAPTRVQEIAEKQLCALLDDGFFAAAPPSPTGSAGDYDDY